MFFSKTSIVASLGAALPLAPALAFEPELDDAFGLEAARPLQTRLGTSLETGFVDASIETRNTSSEELDQRYFAIARFDAAYSPVPPLGIRAFGRGSYVDGLRQDSLSADRKVKDRFARANGGLDFSFAATQGIEAFAGMGVSFLPRAKKVVETGTISSETRYRAVTAYTPRAGLLKRTPVFAAGLFLSLMNEQKRKYTRVTGVEEETGEEKVTVPSTLGGMARFTLNKDTEIDVELALVRMGESEEKTEQDAPYYRDYYRVHAGGMLPLFAFGGVYASLDHRTLSYNDQGFMTIENIPLTTLEVRAVTSGPARWSAGIVFGYGSDSQSIPELNADFTHLSYAVKLGLEVPM